jgi:anti-anti-sigma regulatory factor
VKEIGLAARGDAPRTIVLVVRGTIGRSDIPRLCGRVHLLVEGSDAGQVVCDVGDLVTSDLTALDALARMALTVRRLGRQMLLQGAGPDLTDLVALAGLDGVLRVEPDGQAEQREDPLGVEVVVEANDPPA